MQTGVETDVVVVGNGWQPEGLTVRTVALAEDRGIPAGRNAGVGAVGGELLFFLDDDARLASPDALARVAERFEDPGLGMLQLRVRSSDGGPAPRDWVPRLRVGDPARSSEVTAVWEGAVAVRRTVFEQAGGWPEVFRFAHEGVDLAWRVMDTGRRVEYAGDIEVLHPSYRTAPHDYSAYYGARNRVFLARRNLPLPLGDPLRRRLRAPHAAAAARSRRAARLPRRAAPAVRPAPPPACEHSVAHDTSRPAAADLAASLSLPLTAPVTDREHHQRTDEFTSVRHVYEPHRVGLPPLGSYLRELWKRREFALELSRTELRAQHYNTLFGQLWLILSPLLLACVYFVLVDILRARTGGIVFFAHLMAALFAYYFVTDAIRQAVRSVVGGGRLILNTAFPRLLLPVASVITAFWRFLPTILIFLPVFFVADLPVGPHLLWLIPVFALFAVLATGLAALVAAGQVYFRDLKNFLTYALRLWLYGSPILYLAAEVPDRYQFLLVLNPLAPLLTAWSDVIDLGRAPDPADLAIGAAWAFAFFIAGALFFISTGA